ncbi:methyl-accepting chemotaxis sensory transducer with Cache sensor [Rhizobium sp. PP-WC-2G-219]|nr:methyl-accepting chemotaxis sensory transducer with Cache sensor [Rhizobium sp. PP-CC-3A-592]PYE44794.1 methyl-accepting chemotaxis sensory transducer with Cache sensor [Rhizobium sp. PP-F2F-G20b]TCL94042.1 methyl-accepting chemotaxis sensory transducer with Cache sensor [Rhizobium sp. PP-WC-2G-219]
MKYFRISVRLYALVAMALLIMAGAMTYSLFQAHDRLVSERKAMLAAMDQSAIGIFTYYNGLETAGTMTQAAAQAAAIDAVKAMRYQNNGYLWINDMQARVLMHPIKPEMNGTDQSGLADTDGKKIFVEFVKVVAANGQGTVDYHWPKPGVDTPVLKYSYVIGFQPWGWVVGTGVYADDLAAMFRQGLIQLAVISGIAALLILGVALAVVRSVVGPVERLKASMLAISREDVSSPVPETDRGDEIGQMASALGVLRDSVSERIAQRAREATQQSEIETERRGNEVRTARQAQEQAEAMATVGAALEALARGDLTAEIGAISPEYAKLRDDFNQAVAALAGAVQSIAHSTDVVHENAGDISEAAGNLSRRTEQQAAALEETAAALDQITSTVRNASERAGEARSMVAETKSSAAKSGEIVRSAIAAMSRIEGSSERISQIIGVIDEIAFQTNLLALNAGVEAARAGEAGRGFAVVAQEVRELAQRSAQAAKEIKELIRSSTGEVETGVALVRSTGDALMEIETLVNRVNDHVASIATAAREQATGLQEVNVAVNSMDQMTQQNAAMVEETTAASQTLAQESRTLKDLLQTFRLAGGGERSVRRAA